VSAAPWVAWIATIHHEHGPQEGRAMVLQWQAGGYDPLLAPAGFPDQRTVVRILDALDRAQNRGTPVMPDVYDPDVWQSKGGSIWKTSTPTISERLDRAERFAAQAYAATHLDYPTYARATTSAEGLIERSWHALVERKRRPPLSWRDVTGIEVDTPRTLWDVPFFISDALAEACVHTLRRALGVTQ
jgi:hypothetical protein